MLCVIILAIIFTSWVIAPLLPKERYNPTVIHNNIHIINNPNQSNSIYKHNSKAGTSEDSNYTEGAAIFDRRRF